MNTNQKITIDDDINDNMLLISTDNDELKHMFCGVLTYNNKYDVIIKIFKEFMRGKITEAEERTTHNLTNVIQMVILNGGSMIFVKQLLSLFGVHNEENTKRLFLQQACMVENMDVVNYYYTKYIHEIQKNIIAINEEIYKEDSQVLKEQKCKIRKNMENSIKNMIGYLIPTLYENKKFRVLEFLEAKGIRVDLMDSPHISYLINGENIKALKDIIKFTDTNKPYYLTTEMQVQDFQNEKHEDDLMHYLNIKYHHHSNSLPFIKYLNKTGLLSDKLRECGIRNAIFNEDLNTFEYLIDELSVDYRYEKILEFLVSEGFLAIEHSQHEQIKEIRKKMFNSFKLTLLRKLIPFTLSNEGRVNVFIATTIFNDANINDEMPKMNAKQICNCILSILYLSPNRNDVINKVILEMKKNELDFLNLIKEMKQIIQICEERKLTELVKYFYDFVMKLETTDSGKRIFTTKSLMLVKSEESIIHMINTYKYEVFNVLGSIIINDDKDKLTMETYEKILANKNAEYDYQTYLINTNADYTIYHTVKDIMIDVFMFLLEKNYSKCLKIIIEKVNDSKKFIRKIVDVFYNWRGLWDDERILKYHNFINLFGNYLTESENNSSKSMASESASKV